MSLRRGILSKHLQSDEIFATSVDSGANLGVGDETINNEQTAALDWY